MKNTVKRVLLYGVLSLLCLALSGCGGRTGSTSEAGDFTSGTDSQTDSQAAENQAAENQAAENQTEAAAAGNYTVEIEVQDYGTIRAELDGEAAPLTVRNFVSLAESGFYDGLTFHRIMDGFMIQGGDPDGNGFGGADTNIPGEFASNGWNNPISHTRGTVSMARAQNPNSASSQFFIVQSDSAFLDGSYAAFGRVTEGMDVVDAICANVAPLALDDNGTIAAEDQPVMISVKVSPADSGE